jgi:uncharacterized SAM-binding protein YcdF (DUF218 family)
MKIKRKSVFRIIRIFLLTLGSFFLLLSILAFTTLPYYARYWLGIHKGCVDKAPSEIILLGGAGMPSDDGLMRSYYTALLGNKYPGSGIIIALPGDTTDTLSSPCLLKKELVMRGIKSDRVAFESNGHNTRQQALKIFDRFGIQFQHKPIALVTSPEHMYRAVLSFEKAGFDDVKGLPTFENSIEEDDLYFKDKDLKGNQFVPPIGQTKQIRYQFWTHLKYEILVIREAFALGYYKMRAWI